MFRLRERIVDPSLNRVTSRGQTVQVEPKIMQVLVALADRPAEVVTREELMARVWPGVFVTDDVLHRAIRELRRMSTPGLRRYVKCREIPRVKNGLGMAIVSTPKGLMSDREARTANLGGELVALIW